MGYTYPKYPTDTAGGDEVTHAPTKGDRSLLGAERGTDKARRLETDANNNLYVSVAASPATSPASVSALANGAVAGITDSTLTTIVTFSAASDTKITRIGCSGTCYAKYQLFLNTTLVETKRSGPERSIDFLFDRPWAMVTGDILDVKVTHFVTGSTDDFEATIYGG